MFPRGWSARVREQERDRKDRRKARRRKRSRRRRIIDAIDS